MGLIADQLTELSQRMKASDKRLKRLINGCVEPTSERRLKRLIDDHIESTERNLKELKELSEKCGVLRIRKIHEI